MTSCSHFSMLDGRNGCRNSIGEQECRKFRGGKVFSSAGQVVESEAYTIGREAGVQRGEVWAAWGILSQAGHLAPEAILIIPNINFLETPCSNVGQTSWQSCLVSWNYLTPLPHWVHERHKLRLIQ